MIRRRSVRLMLFTATCVLFATTRVLAQETTWVDSIRLAKECQSQGRYKEAIAHSRVCVQIAETENPPNLGKLADSYGLHASVCHDLAQYQETEDCYNKSLRCMDQLNPIPWRKRFLVFNNLGALYCDLGAFKKAEVHFQAALEVVKAQPMPSASDLGTCVSNIGVLNKLQGRHTEAHDFYKMAHKVLEAGDKSLLIGSFNNLVNLCIESDDLDAAEKYVEAYQKTVDELGKEHPTYSRFLHTRSKLLIQQQRYEGAEAACREAIRLSERLLGGSHPYTASCYVTLGTIQFKRRAFVEAEASIRKAITVYEESFNLKQHPRIAEGLTVLGDLYFVLGDYERSDNTYQHALQMLRECFHDDQHSRMKLVQGKRGLVQKERQKQK